MGDRLDAKDYLVVIGAPKCGTTSLATWLSRLPDAAMAKSKETLFFTDYPARQWSGPGAGFTANAAVSEADFRAEFDHAPDAGLRIEASTDNMSCPAACARIAAFAARDDVRSLKVVAVLRDPIDRIVSEFEHTLRLGWQKPDLMASLKAEPDRVAEGWHPLFHHVDRSRYATQLAPFKAAFGEDLMIVDFHRISALDTLARLAAFAGRGDAELPAGLERQNARTVYARPRAETVLRNARAASAARAIVPRALRARVRAMLRGAPQSRYAPTPDERAFMTDLLRDDIERCRADPDIPTDHWR